MISDICQFSVHESLVAMELDTLSFVVVVVVVVYKKCFGSLFQSVGCNSQ